METMKIDPLALNVARNLFGFGVKSTAIAAMASGVMTYLPEWFGVEIPRDDYLRVLDGYTRALSM